MMFLEIQYMHISCATQLTAKSLVEMFLISSFSALRWCRGTYRRLQSGLKTGLRRAFGPLRSRSWNTNTDVNTASVWRHQSNPTADGTTELFTDESLQETHRRRLKESPQEGRDWRRSCYCQRDISKKHKRQY